MNLHRVKAQFTSNGRGTVELDGHPLTTTRVQVDAGVDQVPLVTITLLCETLEIETEGELIETAEGELIEDP